MKTVCTLLFTCALILTSSAQNITLRMNDARKFGTLNALCSVQGGSSLIVETQILQDSACVMQVNEGDPTIRVLGKVEATTSAFPHIYSTDGQWYIAIGRNAKSDQVSGLDVWNLKQRAHNRVAFGPAGEKCWFESTSPSAPFGFSSDNSYALVRIFKMLKGKWSRMIAVVDLQQARVKTFIVDTAYASRTDLTLVDVSFDNINSSAILVYRNDTAAKGTCFIRVMDIGRGSVREMKIDSVATAAYAKSRYSVDREKVTTVIYGPTGWQRIIFDPVSMAIVQSSHMTLVQDFANGIDLRLALSPTLNRMAVFDSGRVTSPGIPNLFLFDLESNMEMFHSRLDTYPTLFVIGSDERSVVTNQGVGIQRINAWSVVEFAAKIPSVTNAQMTAPRSIDVFFQNSTNGPISTSGIVNAVSNYGQVTSWVFDSERASHGSVIRQEDSAESIVEPSVSGNGNLVSVSGYVSSQTNPEIKSPSGSQCCFFRDGKRYVSRSQHRVNLCQFPYSVATVKVLQIDATALAISPNDSIVAVSDVSGAVLLINVSDLSVHQHLGYVSTTSRSLQFSPDGSKLMALLAGDRVVVWSLAEPSVIMFEVITGATSACFSSGSKELLVASRDSSIYLWNLAQSRMIGCARSIASLMSIAASHDGQYIACGTNDNRVLMWNFKEFEVHTSAISAAQDSLIVYPNPALSGQVSVQLRGARDIIRISIYNSLGEELVQTTEMPESSTATLDVSSLANGAYTVVTRNDGYTLSKRFIVARP